MREIVREVEKTIVVLKCGKAIGIDGIAAQMLKYGEVIADWMILIM